MKFFSVLFLSLTIFTVSYSQNNFKNPDYIFSPKDVKNNIHTVDLVSCNGKAAGSIVCFSFEDFLKFKNFNAQKYLVEIIAKNGRYYFEQSDFDSEIQKMTPYFSVEKQSTIRFGDTLTIAADDIKNIDFSQLDKEVTKISKQRVKLQFSLSKTDANKYLKPYSLIFPMDISTKRWITDIEEIKIYNID